MRVKMRLDDVTPRQVGGVHALFNLHEPGTGVPAGAVKFTIDDPQAISELVVGKSYLFEITPAD